MNARPVAIAFLACLMALTWVAWGALRPPDGRAVDLPGMNDVAQQLIADFDAVGRAGVELPRPDGVPDYAVMDARGRAIAATSGADADSLGAAIANRDTVMPLVSGGRLLGHVAFASADADDRAADARRLRWIFTGVAAGVGVLGLVGLWWIDRRILRPFREMDGFARRVAAGDLDAPLRMDRANSFGAFTEAFDLMRHELAATRDRERAAERSKAELVASLSHDIKTPVASIKAVAEVMAAQGMEVRAAERLNVIVGKADQIDALVTDLFHATLEELEALTVIVRDIPSPDLAAAITAADDRSWCPGAVLPDCLVRADPLRFAQTVGNIIANAYKYAAPPLTVTGGITDGSLVVVFADAGPGVDEDELDLVATKFYRGRAAEGGPGAGLGLFLADHFMRAMGGQLTCANTPKGFQVTITLPLA
jgi:signal transduction histidine kinase